MWKFGLTNLITELNERLLAGTVAIAYEQKIPKTAFSVETSLAVNGNINKKKSFVSKNDNKYALNIGIMPRYYYDLRKRIAGGKSADNLSGDYFGAKFDYTTAQKIDDLKVQSKGVTLLWGSQQRILKRLNFDFWIGYRVASEKANKISKISRGLAFDFALQLAF